MSSKRSQPTITAFFTKKPRSTTPIASDTLDGSPVPLPEQLRNKQDHAASDWCSKFGIPENAADCTTADFVKRGPAHRPPNLFFVKLLAASPDLLRSVIQAYVTMGQHQPVYTSILGTE
ncbi:hypothetical protein PI124_g1718 [Phytophthora idaei]|nr:hypothetical protein PI125_g5403 [Phytophthora idaei]KAG3161094.1 hypothetical protein PI126_g6599 [Phytophthora idaei]KAG3253716.1 hypothetical protein PI124_g1718 [Phytophthora idaei]